jgi:hypothetical protein
MPPQNLNIESSRRWVCPAYAAWAPTLHRALVSACLLSLALGSGLGCTPDDCTRTASNGELVATDLTYWQGPDEMSLRYTVANGLDEDVYVVDSVMKIHYDGDASAVEYEMRLDIPDVIHIAEYSWCYREIPAGCACEIRRRTELDYWSLAEDMPVHEVDVVEIDVGWSSYALDPPADAMSMGDYDAWTADREEGTLQASHTRNADERVALGELPEETEPSSCWTVFF